jgi:quercetin dioxygenase-like cupin family protein
MGTVHRYVGRGESLDWANTPEKVVDDPGARGVTGRVLVGPEDGASNFRIRYFRIEPGGHSPLENHAHDHGIFILHGRAEVRLGSRSVVVGPRDVVYVPGNERHQLTAIGQDSLGFLCVIPPK